VERVPRGEGEAAPVNRIEPRIVPHEPDPDLLADARRLDGWPPDEHGQRRKLSENVEFCDQYARDRGSAELKPSDASRLISS
jgi:hypothetical protein